MTFSQKVTICSQLVNISPTLFLLIVASRIYALFVAKSTSVPGLGGGGGGLSQSWQCQDFDSTYFVNPSQYPAPYLHIAK